MASEWDSVSFNPCPWLCKVVVAALLACYRETQYSSTLLTIKCAAPARNDLTTSSANSLMIDIQQLSFQYPGTEQPAVDSVSLQIERGALFGLLGPNGAGKTTLVSLIAGLCQPQAGRILIDGRVARLGQRSVAVVPQEYAFYGRLSAVENLAYFAGVLGLTGADKAQALAGALQAAGLNEVAQRRAETYSGGFKRRLNFAIGILRRPQVLILDEATANVDPQSRAFLLDTIRDLNREGVTIIYTSHLLDEVQQLCRSAAIIDVGRLLRQGTMQELLHPQEKTSLSIDLDHPPNSALLAQLQCQLQGQQRLHWPQWQALDELAILLATIASSGCKVQSIHYGSQSLENLFLTLTSHAPRD